MTSCKEKGSTTGKLQTDFVIMYDSSPSHQQMHNGAHRPQLVALKISGVKQGFGLAIEPESSQCQSKKRGKKVSSEGATHPETASIPLWLKSKDGTLAAEREN